jgi:hypothetical protein
MIAQVLSREGIGSQLRKAPLRPGNRVDFRINRRTRHQWALSQCINWAENRPVGHCRQTELKFRFLRLHRNVIYKGICILLRGGERGTRTLDLGIMSAEL